MLTLKLDFLHSNRLFITVVTKKQILMLFADPFTQCMSVHSVYLKCLHLIVNGTVHLYGEFERYHSSVLGYEFSVFIVEMLTGRHKSKHFSTCLYMQFFLCFCIFNNLTKFGHLLTFKYFNGHIFTFKVV